jgi:zinc protease
LILKRSSAFRAAILANLKQQDEDPSRAAVKAWYAAYFGAHPYGRPQEGTPAGIAAIKPEDIKAFAADHFVAAVSRSRCPATSTRCSSRNTCSSSSPRCLRKPCRLPAKPANLGNPGTRTVVRNEAAPVAIFGFLGPMRADPDYIPAFVTNYIFGGGGFSARLMDEVRDKRGLTYGISTQLNDFRASSIIVGSVQSDKAKILTALDVTKSEMARFAKTVRRRRNWTTPRPI